MPYVLPNFNLVCAINTFNPGPGTITFRLTSPCNFALGKRVSSPGFLAGPYADVGSGVAPLLLLPAFTDIRDGSCSNAPDIVEVPQGSGRYYVAYFVDDIGKGFANEHRYATLAKTWPFAGNPWLGAPFWPTPIP